MRSFDFTDLFESSNPPTGGSSNNDTQALANNQAATTFLTVDSDDFRNLIIEGFVRRKTDSSERRSYRQFALAHEATGDTWVLFDITNQDDGTADGVTFTVTSALGVASLKYATDNHTGANYSGEFVYVASYFEA